MREEAVEAARSAVAAHAGRRDVQAVHLHRTLQDLRELTDRLDQRLEEWGGGPSPGGSEGPPGEEGARAEPPGPAPGPKAEGERGPEDPRHGGSTGPPGPPERTRDLLEGVRAEVAHLEERLEATLQEAAPNLLRLLGPNLAGALLSEAGTLDDLARMAATKVQVLGAKRAVLRAKAGGKPPKHGVLFLHPEVAEAEPADRGKAAKDLAARAVLAARADAFTGRDLEGIVERRDAPDG